jgi:hypothetical protein
VPIHPHFERAAGSLDEFDLSTESLLQLCRQTGGTRIVVSNNAILDRHLLRHRPSVEPFRPSHATRSALKAPSQESA